MLIGTNNYVRPNSYYSIEKLHELIAGWRMKWRENTHYQFRIFAMTLINSQEQSACFK